ncbi:unnamed protein product [Mycena citricolor]|uniref:Copper-fist domain-containing protein n=1 Tax=Mycena citricolor TaxID=2018698 RepID=A0AAD2H965_9AGAR|nr:unnamed protein product [Mycena citricolor]
MVLIDTTNYACEPCIRGHRASSCTHESRPLVEVAPRGRPQTQCGHCKELRRVKQVHITCTCGAGGCGSKGKGKGKGKAADPDARPACMCSFSLECTCWTPRARPKAKATPNLRSPASSSPSPTLTSSITISGPPASPPSSDTSDEPDPDREWFAAILRGDEEPYAELLELAVRAAAAQGVPVPV